MARVCPLLVGKESTQEAQKWILNIQLQIERLLTGRLLPAIFDGCSLGHLAYYQYWGGAMKIFREQVIESTLSFDRIFLLPPNPNFLFDDGLRPVDIDFQQRIFKIQKELLDSAGIQYEFYDPLKDFEGSFFIKENSSAIGYKRNKIKCIVRNNDKYLLVSKNFIQEDEDKRLWGIIGGEIENGETYAKGAERLILEKTGYLSKAKNYSQDDSSTHEYQIFECNVSEQTRFTVKLHTDTVDEKWVTEKEFLFFLKKDDI